MCKASSVVCGPLFWAYLCLVVKLTVRPTERLATAVNQEHDIAQKNSTEFLFIFNDFILLWDQF